MVFLEHRPRVFYSLIYYSNRSHGTVCTTTCKGRNYCTAIGKWRNYCRSIPRDHASWGKMAAIPDDCERTATVALPTAAGSGFISGEVGISAALDAFSTVYELPLTRFKKGQTDRQTDRQTNRRTCTITIPRFTLRVTRGNYCKWILHLPKLQRSNCKVQQYTLTCTLVLLSSAFSKNHNI